MIDPRRSPVHDWLESREPQWNCVGGMPIAVRLRTEEAEREALKLLALCDLSALTKLGVKGRDAERWLNDHDIHTPSEIYESRRLADDGIIVRLGTDEFLLESGYASELVPALNDQLQSQRGLAFPVTRQDATFLLTGERAIDVLAQTCGINFRVAAPRRLILTRLAGVSCGVFPDSINETPCFRIWIDPSQAVYLWEVLVEILASLDGFPIGAGCVFPEFLT